MVSPCPGVPSGPWLPEEEAPLSRFPKDKSVICHRDEGGRSLPGGGSSACVCVCVCVCVSLHWCATEGITEAQIVLEMELLYKTGIGRLCYHSMFIEFVLMEN